MNKRQKFLLLGFGLFLMALPLVVPSSYVGLGLAVMIGCIVGAIGISNT